MTILPPYYRMILFRKIAHPVSLKFYDRIQEAGFKDYYIRRYLWQLRLAHILAIVFFFVAVLTEASLDHIHILSPILRIAIIVPVFIIGYILSYAKKAFYTKYYFHINAIYVMLTGVSFIASGFLEAPPYNHILYSGLIISLIFNYTFIRQPVIYASILGFVLLIVYFGAQFFNTHDFGLISHVSIYIAVANFLGMFICYVMEYDSRISFILSEQTTSDAEKIKSYNLNLEKRIQERTRELEHEKAKAEESDRLKTAFLLNFSHEIRTPMNSIMGFAELLENKNLSGEKLKKYASIIKKGSQRMLNTLNHLMDMSLIEANLIKVELSEVNINLLMKEVHELFLPEARLKGLSFSCTPGLSTPDAILTTDKDKLYTILSNLVRNAIKYTENGEIHLGYTLTKHEVEFFCTDTGAGIPKERQQAIFEAFVQADIEDKDAYQGIGLGLSIVKSYLNMMGGKIWLESNPGKGSSFWFTIPVADFRNMPQTYHKRNSI